MVTKASADGQRGDANSPHDEIFDHPVSIRNINSQTRIVCNDIGFPVAIENPTPVPQMGVLPEPDWDTESEGDQASRAESEKSTKSATSKGLIRGKPDELVGERKSKVGH